jgi:hypothetical protein
VANLNRRSKGKSSAEESIEALKAEIDALKSLYQRDMGNISLDMQALNQQIQASTVDSTDSGEPSA